MARTVSTMDELPIMALPAATCCTERALAPESIKSMSSPCARKKPFSLATIAGQMETLTPITTVGTGTGACAAAGRATAPAVSSARAAMRNERRCCIIDLYRNGS